MVLWPLRTKIENMRASDLDYAGEFAKISSLENLRLIAEWKKVPLPWWVSPPTPAGRKTETRRPGGGAVSFMHEGKYVQKF